MTRLKGCLFISIALLISGCVETKQVYYINPNGSGKVRIEATSSQMRINTNPGEEEQEGPTREDSAEMYKRVRKLIEKAEGVKAWDSVQYGLSKEGKTTFSGVAYFSDISKLQFRSLPLVPVIRFNENQIAWGVQPKPVDTANPRPYRDSPLSKKAVQERVKSIQRQFKRESKMVEMAASMFELTAIYHLPYKVEDVKGAQQIGKRKIKLSLAIDSMMSRLSALMKNEEKLQELVAKKGVNSFDMDNKHLLKAAYNGKAFKKVTFKTGLFSGSPVKAFDFSERVEEIAPKHPEIPKLKDH